MKTKTTSKAVPELRFPEFRDAPEWGEKQLSEVLSYERPDKFIVSDTKYKASGTPVLTANKSFILGYTDEEQGVYENFPVVIFDDFTTDKKYVDFPFKVKSSAIKILKANKNNNLKTIYEIMNQIKFDPKGHKRYYISEYQNLIICLPGEQEQQKIADCLSSIDELITEQSKKVEALKEHKSGMMQQLFPAEGETQPILRFPEFRDAPEWEMKELSQLARVEASDLALNKLKFVDENHGYPVYGASGLAGYISSFAQNEDYIAIVKDGAGVGNLFYFPKQTSLLGTLNYIKSKGENSQEWLFYLLGTIDFSKYIKGTGIPHVYFSDYSHDIVPVPNLKEQQKIADCLSSIDELIEEKSQKVESLKKHKEGMMQKLFPAI